MPTFLHTPLLWGLLAVGVPVLIHLINMLRHRRVQWAAMEFLLVSQKKNRTWVLLKQLLLLLLRMTAIAVLVLTVAKPRLSSQFAGLFGSATTHHIVLLDDSYSMSDRWDVTSAFEEAKAVVQRIGEQTAREAQSQTFTLLRLSRAGQTAHGTQPDLLQEPVGPDFTDRLKKLLHDLSPSQTAAGPVPALEAIGQLMGDAAGDQRMVYLVSDFRARQWADAGDLRRHLARLQQSGATLYLLHCVDDSHANLAITDLTPGEDTRAAGVPLPMEVTVQNFGSRAVKDVAVMITADGQPHPAVTIAEIAPGRWVKERFTLQFAAAGEHRVTARLEADAVAADNLRFCVVDVPVAVPVLIVDGDPESRGAWYLSAALAPGGPAPSGISPRIETPRYLSLNPLDEYRAIYLLNVDRLDESAIDALDRYVASGHGLAVFLGDRCQPKHVNEQWHRGGKGFFPVPLAAQAELMIDRLQPAPDLEVSRHPIFQVFAGSRNPFISTVNVSRYITVADDWQAQNGSRTEVIARLRNGAPLAVERHFGEGRVVAFLTTVAPVWNNWARGNPSFLVTMQRLQSYLAWQPKANDSHRVGSPLEVRLDAARYSEQVRLTTPNEDTAPTPPTEAVLAPDGRLTASLAATDFAGFYKATLHRKDGAEETRTWACNVEPEEGDLKTLDIPQLSARLEGIPCQMARASQFHYTPGERASGQLNDALLYLLIALLVGEQILAWSASYHPPAWQRQLAQGGAT